MAADAFGNALGNSLAGAIKEYRAEKQAQYSNIVGQTTPDLSGGLNESTDKLVKNLQEQYEEVTDAGLNSFAYNHQQFYNAYGDYALGYESAYQNASGVRQANDFLAGARRNGNEIQNFITTTNRNRDIAATARKGISQIRNERYANGARVAQAGFDSIGSTGIDIRTAYDWEAATAFENAAWADGKRRTQTLEDGLQYVGDTVKNSFSFYKDAIVNWPDNFERTIDRYNGLHQSPNSIAESLSFNGKLGNTGGSFALSFALGNDGKLGFNPVSFGYGPDPKAGVTVNLTGTVEKAYGAEPVDHLTGHQLDISAGVDLGLMSAGGSTGGLYRGIPLDPKSVKTNDTVGYYLSLGRGSELPGRFEGSVSQQYGLESSYKEFDLGIFGKTLYAIKNSIWF